MKNFLLWLFEECLSKPYIEVENGASFYSEAEDDDLFIYFEHSNGREDWFNNLSFLAVPYRDMEPVWKCHSGFLKVWKSTKPYLKDKIKDPRIKRIIIAGYSHGAALAVLCHEYTFYNRPDIRDSIYGFGFGCPRVLFGCAEPDLAKRWDSFRVIRNWGDMVTHLPPSVLGYCHAGRILTIGKEGKYSPIDAHRPESYKAELKYAW